MVLIKFFLDNTDNNNNKVNFDNILFEYDPEKTIREMLIDFVKQNNSKLKIAGKDIESFETTLNADLMTFVCKARLLNKEENLIKKVGQIFRTNNCTVKILDTGLILGGN